MGRNDRFDIVPENLKKGKILDPYLRELLTEQDKHICLNQDKTLGNLQEKVAFVYWPLTKIWTAMEAEKESYVAGNRETNPFFELSKIFDQSSLFEKVPYLEPEEIEGMLTAAGQTLQQQYPTGGQGRSKN